MVVNDCSRERRAHLAALRSISGRATWAARKEHPTATTACRTSPAGRLTKAVWAARDLGLSETITSQPQYSLLVREIE